MWPKVVVSQWLVASDWAVAEQGIEEQRSGSVKQDEEPEGEVLCQHSKGQRPSISSMDRRDGETAQLQAKGKPAYWWSPLGTESVT